MKGIFQKILLVFAWTLCCVPHDMKAEGFPFGSFWGQSVPVRHSELGAAASVASYAGDAWRTLKYGTNLLWRESDVTALTGVKNTALAVALGFVAWKRIIKPIGDRVLSYVRSRNPLYFGTAIDKTSEAVVETFQQAGKATHLTATALKAMAIFGVLFKAADYARTKNLMLRRYLPVYEPFSLPALFALSMVSAFQTWLGHELSEELKDEKTDSLDVRAHDSSVKFKDYKGMIPAQIDLLVRRLQNKQEFERHKVEMGVTGILLYGVPGSGKTYLVRALAGELDVPFISVNIAELKSKWHSETEKNIRSVFKNAKTAAEKNQSKMAIVFFDEIDSIGSERAQSSDNSGNGGSISAVETLLNEMSGLDIQKDVSIIVIGATNKPNKLDQALVRSGRFTHKIVLSLPDEGVRKQLFEYYLSPERALYKYGGVIAGSDKDSIHVTCHNALIDGLVQQTRGCTPADIQAIMRSIKELAAASSAREVGPAECERGVLLWQMSRVEPGHNIGSQSSASNQLIRDGVISKSQHRRTQSFNALASLVHDEQRIIDGTVAKDSAPKSRKSNILSQPSSVSSSSSAPQPPIVVSGDTAHIPFTQTQLEAQRSAAVLAAAANAAVTHQVQQRNEALSLNSNQSINMNMNGGAPVGIVPGVQSAINVAQNPGSNLLNPQDFGDRDVLLITSSNS